MHAKQQGGRGTGLQRPLHIVILGLVTQVLESLVLEGPQNVRGGRLRGISSLVFCRHCTQPIDQVPKGYFPNEKGKQRRKACTHDTEVVEYRPWIDASDVVLRPMGKGGNRNRGRKPKTGFVPVTGIAFIFRERTQGTEKSEGSLWCAPAACED